MIEFGRNSLYFSKLVRSKAKMIEFDIPLESHIPISENAQKSFLVALAIVADTARKYFEDYINHKSINSQLKNQLHHAAEYFDALLLSELGHSAEYKDYIAILGATAYYLGDYNGSSRVIINYISDDMQLLGDSTNLVSVFIEVLTDKIFLDYTKIEGKYHSELNALVESYINYILSKTEFSTDVFSDLQDKVYKNGNDFSIIIVNCLLAVVCKKLNSSSTKLLPEFSDLDFSSWQDYIQTEGSIKELWPSQIELGRKGIFSGKSGIVQMPTSSGKTASINLMLRSAFYSNRVYNALIVAPLERCTEESIRIEKRGKLKPIDMSDVISICDNGLGYETSMILNSINNILEELVGEKIDVITKLTRRLKYGLSLDKEINIYELGFSDRIVAQVIGQEINSQSKDQIKNEIKRKSAGIEDKLSDFPSYYIQLINEI